MWHMHLQRARLMRSLCACCARQQSVNLAAHHSLAQSGSGTAAYGSAEVNRDETRPPLSLKQIYGIPVMHITAVQLQHGQKCNKFSMLVKIQTARLNISTNEWTSLCAPLKQRSRTVKAYKKVFDCFVKFRPSV